MCLLAVRGVSPIVKYDLFRILHVDLPFSESFRIETKEDVEKA